MRISDWSSDVCSSDLHEALRIGHRIAIFEAEHAIFGQRAVEHLEAAVRQRLQRHIFGLGRLVDPDGVALAEGAASRILARQTDLIAFAEQGAEGVRLAGSPVDRKSTRLNSSN